MVYNEVATDVAVFLSLVHFFRLTEMKSLSVVTEKAEGPIVVCPQ